jgi:hypothetical protein
MENAITQGVTMRRFGSLLLLVLTSLVGLVACTAMASQHMDSTPMLPDGSILQPGQAAFIASYADW